MTAPELVECKNCDCWFAAASLDDYFYHATSGCCRERAATAPVVERLDNLRP